MIPEKIANAWITSDITNKSMLFGYMNGKITITVQKNQKADLETIYDAVLTALKDHFKITSNE